ncbi:MAG: ATP-binding protein [Salinivirgaceae bacterium]|jgi:nicotinamide riboside kinase|nr:ATP-binding protein [Salinivirgaceae bacterium]
MSKSGLRIAIIGPESTGKTVLAQKLAAYYKGEYVPEYARTYIEQLHRDYTFQDVKHIGQWLINTWNEYKKQEQPVFFDTEMIITKVWFQVAFNRCPAEMDTWLSTMQFDAFLLCRDDLPWIPDPVRENGGAMRTILFERYRKEIEKLQTPYAIVEGTGRQRIANAVQALSELTSLPDLTKTVWQDRNLQVRLR